MKTYRFSLIITRPWYDDETVADKLYEGGCDDALYFTSNGLYEIEFDREAISWSEAIRSAIDDFERAKIGAEFICVKKFGWINNLLLNIKSYFIYLFKN
jgi:hypothetical protein